MVNAPIRSPSADWEVGDPKQDIGDVIEEIITNTGMDISITPQLVIDGSSGDTDLERAMANLLVSLFELFKKKQRSYGPGNIATFGETGCLIRAYDKIQRLKTLVYDEVPDPLHDEGVTDTWMDLADYALIAILVRFGRWPSV